MQAKHSMWLSLTRQHKPKKKKKKTRHFFFFFWFDDSNLHYTHAHTVWGGQRERIERSVGRNSCPAQPQSIGDTSGVENGAQFGGCDVGFAWHTGRSKRLRSLVVKSSTIADITCFFFENDGNRNELGSGDTARIAIEGQIGNHRHYYL